MTELDDRTVAVMFSLRELLAIALAVATGPPNEPVEAFGSAVRKLKDAIAEADPEWAKALATGARGGNDE